MVSPDGRTLFVTIANHASNVGGKKDQGDMGVYVTEDNQWTAPVHGGGDINNAGFNAVAGMSADGSQLFLLTIMTRRRTKQNAGISVEEAGCCMVKPEIYHSIFSK